MDRFWVYQKEHLCSLKPQTVFTSKNNCIVSFFFLFLTSDSGGVSAQNSEKYSAENYKSSHTSQTNIIPPATDNVFKRIN